MPLPVDQATRDAITGQLRLDDGRVLVQGPLARDNRFVGDVNLVVKAGAGSGKTHALVWRMVALVRCGVDVEHLAAITFTRKAAGEMRARFFEALTDVQEQLAARAEDAKAQDDEATAALYLAEREHVTTALDHIDHVFIDTIHAFCARLLRERPAEVGLPPDFGTVEDRDEELMRRRAWQRYLRRRFSEDPEAFVRLERMGVEPQDLFDFFGRLCRFEGLDVLAEATPRPDLEAATEAVRSFVGRWHAELPQPYPVHRDGAMNALVEAYHVMEYHGIETDGDRVRLLEIFEGALKTDTRKSTDADERGDVTKKRWTEAGVDASVPKALDGEALPALVQETVRPALCQWRAYLYRFVHDFAGEAVEHYRAQRFREGRLTFHDLLSGAARLLRDDAGARRYFRDRYRVLLVDEFQDTDPVQAEVLFCLAADDVHESDWRTCRLEPGRLFIVGDAKQSIYRFRRADVQVFDDVCGLIEDSGGRVLHLTTNFRSRPRLCAWCDGRFQDIFPRLTEPEGAATSYQTDYEQLRPFREDTNAPAVRLLRTAKVHGNYASDIAEQEAEAIARFIRAAGDGRAEALCGDDGIFGEHARFGDFMILARLSKRLDVYARHLEAHGIPYQISGGSALGEADELRAVVDLLTCVLRPDDAVACVAYLRGLCCGFSSDALYRFTQADGTFDGALDVPDALSDDDAEAFGQAFALLDALEHDLGRTTMAAALERTFEQSGLLAWSARTRPGSSRAGVLFRLLALVQQREAQGLHWTEILEELRLLLDGELEAEGLTLETGSDEAVRLMTVHQSKGLQARVVFMADPYDGHHNPTPSAHVGRDKQGRPFAVVPAFRSVGEHGRRLVAAPLHWQRAVDGVRSYEEEEVLYDEAEHDRLTYVAATRAEDLLVVSCYDAKPGDGFWHRLYPPDDDALPVLPVPLPEVDAGVPEQVVHGWEALAAERDRRRTTVERESYSVKPVTLQVKDDGVLHRAGYGRAFGTAVHRLFEHAVLHRDDPLPAEEERVLVAELLNDASRRDEADMSPADVDRAVAALASLRTSELWRALKAAEVVGTEVPFAHAAGDGASAVTTGTVDLVYRTAGGWHLVDYKTDRVDGTLVTLTNRYAPQVRAYAEHWSELTGEEVCRAALWFVDAGRVVDVL